MLEYKTLRINDDEKLCYINDEVIKLTKSEYCILKFLLENQGKIFSREELLSEAWTESVSTRAVDTAISRLRRKLKEYGKCIITRLGFGYGFIKNI